MSNIWRDFYDTNYIQQVVTYVNLKEIPIPVTTVFSKSTLSDFKFAERYLSFLVRKTQTNTIKIQLFKLYKTIITLTLFNFICGLILRGSSD